MKIKIYFKNWDPIVLNKVEKTTSIDGIYHVFYKNGEEETFSEKDIFRILKQYGAE